MPAAGHWMCLCWYVNKVNQIIDPNELYLLLHCKIWFSFFFFFPNSGFHWLHLHCACVDIIARCLPRHHFSFRKTFWASPLLLSLAENPPFFSFFFTHLHKSQTCSLVLMDLFFFHRHVLVSYWATRRCYFSLLIALLRSSQCLPWLSSCWHVAIMLLIFLHFSGFQLLVWRKESFYVD